ncbi:MAG: hypothetical protein IJH64_08550 [Oscillospiraceae bacterium]|nr:hypothetical protein [Oscillospiraceae bacterium]
MRFIRKHDPDYLAEDDIDVMRWLYKKSGISWSSIGINVSVPNQYVLSNGKHLSQEELMAMLSERFPWVLIISKDCAFLLIHDTI